MYLPYHTYASFKSPPQEVHVINLMVYEICFSDNYTPQSIPYTNQSLTSNGIKHYLNFNLTVNLNLTPNLITGLDLALYR